ncbi:MAG: glycosyl hydrolase 108 family protein [Cetobacterium sp.]
MKKIVIFLLLLMALGGCSSISPSSEKIWEHVKKYEGTKLVKEPNGYYSKYGLSTPRIRDYNKKYKKSYKVQHLTESQAKVIFDRLYYKNYEIYKIKNDRVKLAVVDTIYNQGTTGIKIIQETVNFLSSRRYRVKVDGRFGNETIGRINRISHYKFLRTLRTKRIAYYRTRPHFRKYGRGWIRRVDDVTRT